MFEGSDLPVDLRHQVLPLQAVAIEMVVSGFVAGRLHAPDR